MRGGYTRLNEFFVEGILAVDTYTESLNKLIKLLEEKSKADGYQSEIQNLKLQKQSLLTTLMLIKNIKRKKLDLLKEFSAQDQSGSSNNFVDTTKLDLFKESSTTQNQNEYIKLKIKFNFKNIKKEIIEKSIILKLDLKDYHVLRSGQKSITLTLTSNNFNSKWGLSKVISHRIKFKDPLR